MKSHLAGLLFFYTLSSWAAPQCRDIFFALDYLPREQHRHELQKEEKLNNRLLNTNWFVTSRGLIEYISEFSKSKTGPNLDLQEKLATLTLQSRWLDAGAGRANAQKEYMLQLKDKINSPELLAVAFKKPFFTGIPSKSKMKYLSGRWFEEIPDSELGTFDVITDFFGPVSYGKDSLEIVNKYLRLLNAGGEIFISMPMNAAVLSTERSKVVSLSEWIKMQLEVSANYEVEISHTRILKIKYLQGPAIQLSRIKQTSFKSGLPPERFYIE